MCQLYVYRILVIARTNHSQQDEEIVKSVQVPASETGHDERSESVAINLTC